MNTARAALMLERMDKFVDKEFRHLDEQQREEHEVGSLTIGEALRQILFEQLDLTEEEVQAAGVVLSMCYMASMVDAYRCEESGEYQHNSETNAEAARKLGLDPEPMDHLVTHFASTFQNYVLSLVGLTTVQKVRA